MRRNAWLKYCVYILLLSVIIFLKEYITGYLEFTYKRTWGAGQSYILLITIPFIFNLMIGAFLGIEHFLVESKKAGTWKISLPKLILLGVPSLFFSLTYHIAGIDTSFVQNTLLRITTFGINFIPAFQIVLGYVLITCFYKRKSKISYRIKY